MLVIVAAALAALAGAARADTADLTLYFGGNGTGTVTSSPPGISCTTDCRATFDVGTTVTLTAKPDAGSAIDDWPNGACQEQGNALSYNGATCTIVMDSDKSVTVYFAKVTLNLYFGGNGQGTVTSSPPGISCTTDCRADFALGTKVTLAAKPAAGSSIDDWPNDLCQEQGSKLSYNGPTCTIVMDSDKSATVYFAQVTLNLYFSGDGSGRVTSSPPGISCTADCKAQFALGTKVTLTARPNTGSAIDDWPNDLCQEQGNKLSYNGPTCTIAMDSDKSATVYFTPANAGGGGTIGGNGPMAPPEAGVSVDMQPESGTTLVKLPGQSTFRKLVGGAQVPIGAVVDTTRGTMTMTSSGGKSRFSRGLFVVREPKVGGVRVTDLALTGGSFAACPKTTKRATAGAGAAPKVIRQLFGSGKGRFRTSGRFASATVRGTAWLVQDRCDGTLTRVTAGKVAVSDLKRHTTVVVTAGHTYLAKR